MPVQPAPLTYRCPACGWSRTVAPRSDVLSSGDYFQACPACAHEPLETKRANAAQAALSQLGGQFKRFLR